jgi:PAS domain S-box-containing protein
MALLSLVGYLYSVPSFYQVPFYTPMAVNTATAFLTLGVGILFARPEQGLVALLTRSGAAGGMARRLFPAALLVPLVLGWLCWRGGEAGYYGTRFGTALFTVSMMLVLALLVWLSAASLEKTEAGRRRAEEEMGLFFGISLEMLCIADFQGHFKRLNPAWEAVLGWTREELQAKPFVEFVHPEDRDATMREAAKIMTGIETLHFENRYRCKDGSYRWLLWNSTPLRERQLMFAAARDITERKKREEEVRELNRQLEERSAGLEAANRELEAFTYSVSHDLRAPLRQVDGFSRILLEDYGPQLDAEAQRLLGRVRDGARHMGELIDDLLNLSRVARQELNIEIAGLNALVQDALAALKQETESRRIEWRIGQLPFVECDPALMRQVFANLLSNALKFTRPREQAVIEVGHQVQNEQAVVYVRDNGVGFSMKHSDQLFGVFQRLHRQEDFPGTGVGLATVQRILAKHGGRIWAEAELDRGAAFFFTTGPGSRPAALQEEKR